MRLFDCAAYLTNKRFTVLLTCVINVLRCAGSTGGHWQGAGRDLAVAAVLSASGLAGHGPAAQRQGEPQV